jgi:hypothetical protein
MYQITRHSAKFSADITLAERFHSTGGYEQTSHRGTSGSIPVDPMWDLSWKNDTGAGFLPVSSVLPVKHHSTVVPYSAVSCLWVWVPLRPTVCRSVGLGVEPHLGLMTGFYVMFDSFDFVNVGRPLWRGVGSVICHCLCPSIVNKSIIYTVMAVP